MQTFLRIIFRLSVFLIILIPTGALLFKILPVEFSNALLADQVSEISPVVFFYAILLTLTGTLKPGDTSFSVISKILLTVFAAFMIIAMSFIITMVNMCGWSTREVLYTKRSSPSVQIVVRSFGCGATDSGSPRNAVFNITPIAGIFIWVSKADTTSLDKSVWQRATLDKTAP
jgi:hypothetical protein